MIHEWYAPHRKGWGITASAFRRDAAYLLLIQIGWGGLLTMTAQWLLTKMSGTATSLALKSWPHRLPIIAQFLLLALASEFIGYWVHRAAHGSKVLWRFHSIHHSSQRLYWLAVSRTHPVETFVQVLLISFPFLVLGVAPQAVSLYLVFVTTNGFYQHSNSEVRLGILNYVLSGPEIHRWHHSSDRRESDTNYGTNLIIWDALFRTRTLPRDRTVREVGASSNDRRTTFFEQLALPFRSMRKTAHSKYSNVVSN